MEGRHAWLQNLMHIKGLTLRRSKLNGQIIPGFINVIFEIGGK